MPALILAALQVNLAGGRLPAPETDGRCYLKIPLNAFPHASWGDAPGLGAIPAAFYEWRAHLLAVLHVR